MDKHSQVILIKLPAPPIKIQSCEANVCTCIGQSENKYQLPTEKSENFTNVVYTQFEAVSCPCDSNIPSFYSITINASCLTLTVKELVINRNKSCTYSHYPQQ